MNIYTYKPKNQVSYIYINPTGHQDTVEINSKPTRKNQTTKILFQDAVYMTYPGQERNII
jgi:hypothetical protein